MVAAAVRIQSNFRGHRARKTMKQTYDYLRKVKKIQKNLRKGLQLAATRALIRNRNLDALQSHHDQQADFQDQWDVVENSPRTEIHVSSYSNSEYTRLTMEKFLQRENIQISRIFRVSDPNLTLIYVTPYEIEEELYNYYMKVTPSKIMLQIFELNGLHDFPLRVKFISPEDCSRYPNHFTILQKLLYSPKALAKIRSLVKNKVTLYIHSSFIIHRLHISYLPTLIMST